MNSTRLVICAIVVSLAAAAAMSGEPAGKIHSVVDIAFYPSSLRDKG